MNTRTKKLCRVGANTIPIARLIGGEVIARKLETTPPEDRSWKLAVGAAIVLGSDAIDGFLARIAGKTKFGGWEDQLVDKRVLYKIFKTLSENGEIPPSIHQEILTRDIGVTATRLIAASRNVNADAQDSGKAKAALGAAAIVVACSPLSQNSGLVNALADATNTSSLSSGLGQTINLMQAAVTNQPERAAA